MDLDKMKKMKMSMSKSEMAAHAAKGMSMTDVKKISTKTKGLPLKVKAGDRLKKILKGV